MKWIYKILFSIAFVCASLPCGAMHAEDQVYNGGKGAFASCAHLEGVHVLAQGKIVCLRGTINPAMFMSLVTVKSEIAQQPYVVVSGIGGYENSAVYIVRLLEPLEPIPVVGDMCASACAQFLFLMGDQRVVLHCADIAIHGGPPSMDQILARKATDEAKENMISAMWRFEKFYADRGISMDMVTKPPAAVQKKLDAGQIVFWPWSINQLRAFGVKGIISRNDPGRVVPADYGDVCIKPLPAAAHRTGV